VSHNDMTTAQKNLTQAAEIETSSAWSVARLIAASVEKSQGARSDIRSQDRKLTIAEASSSPHRSARESPDRRVRRPRAPNSA